MFDIPLLNLGRLHASIAPELEQAFTRTVRDSAFIGGPAVAEFETAFAIQHGCVGAVGCGSGTDALSLALRACGVGPGDSVVVPSMTFAATAEAVVNVGAEPCIADVDPATLLLTADTVQNALKPTTKAIVPVHLYGSPVSAGLIKEWRANGFIVIEDAAQAHLATTDGLSVGSVGEAAAFSFYPGKNLGALGDGGIVTSCSEAVLDQVRVLRDHGRREKYVHDTVGFSSRLDGIQAAFLAAKLPHLAKWTAARKTLAQKYAGLITDFNASDVSLIPAPEGAVHHLLVVRIGQGRRAQVRSVLEQSGVETGIHYPLSLSQQPAFSRWSKPTPVADQASVEVLSLPLDPLMTENEVSTVVSTLRSALEQH